MPIIFAQLFYDWANLILAHVLLFLDSVDSFSRLWHGCK